MAHPRRCEHAKNCPNHPMPRLILDRLSKAFSGPHGRAIPALCDFSLALEAGEFLAVVGPSGSGKTTLLRLIAGLEEPDQGSVVWNGKDLIHSPPQDREVAMVFQHHALLPHLTVAQNLGLGLKLRHTPRAQIEPRVRETAQKLDLTDCLDRLPKDISGGQRQRVALGRALLRNPGIFLFDEPLASLDAPLRVEMRQEIRRLHAQTGAVSLYVTHDQGEAMALGQRVAVLDAGRLRQVDTPSALFQRPANRFVAAFLGSPPMNFFPGRLEIQNGRLVFTSVECGVRLSVPDNQTAALKSQLGKAVELGLRPEHISPATPGSPSAATPLAHGRLLAVEPQGTGGSWWHLQVGPQTAICHAGTQTCPGLESEVPIEAGLTQCHWFDGLTGERIGD